MIIAETCRQALKDMGINPDRLALEWVSAAEAPRFTELITGFVSKIKSLGPLGSGDDEAGKDIVQGYLMDGVKAASARKVRIALGKLAKDMHKSGNYDTQIISTRVAKEVLPAFQQERVSQQKKAREAREEAYKILEVLPRRCAKHLSNGPCGGSVGGRCEADPKMPCIWQKIYERLISLKQEQLLREIMPMRDWRLADRSRRHRKEREESAS